MQLKDGTTEGRGNTRFTESLVLSSKLCERMVAVSIFTSSFTPWARRQDITLLTQALLAHHYRLSTGIAPQ